MTFIEINYEFVSVLSRKKCCKNQQRVPWATERSKACPSFAVPTLAASNPGESMSLWLTFCSCYAGGGGGAGWGGAGKDG